MLRVCRSKDGHLLAAPAPAEAAGYDDSALQAMVAALQTQLAEVGAMNTELESELAVVTNELNQANTAWCRDKSSAKKRYESLLPPAIHMQTTIQSFIQSRGAVIHQTAVAL